MDPLRIGLLGFGTVGQGTWAVLTRNASEISRRAGRELKIKRIAVRDLNKPRSVAVDDHVAITDDPFSLINAPDIDIIVELMGGLEPACELVESALKNGKHVVTANKELLATHGNSLFPIAQQNSVALMYEAAVCGGIPIIKAIREGLAANQINSLVGIINGTSNYILTGMKHKHCSFENMLEEAQTLGYAEADPTFDIEGIDALHKLSILSSIAFGMPLTPFESIHCEGIGTITYDDVTYADELGFEIKQLAIARRGTHGIEMRVHPTLISKQRMLAKVDGVMNGILVSSDAVGKTLYYGAGAGSEPTASSVVADLIDVCRSLSSPVGSRVPYLGFQPNALTSIPIVPIEKTETANYLRMNAVNRAGVLAQVTRILGDHEISIESILQKGLGQREEILPVVIVTQETVEENMQLATKELTALPTVMGEINRIRIDSLT